MLDDVVDVGKQTAAVFVQTVERTGLDQLFQLFAVGLSDVDPVHEVGNILKRTARFAFGNQRLHVGFADALDRRQRVTDLAVFHRKVVTGFINVRRQHRYPHLAAFVLEKLQLVGVGNVKAHGRAHKFDRIMRLEVSPSG